MMFLIRKLLHHKNNNYKELIKCYVTSTNSLETIEPNDIQSTPDYNQVPLAPNNTDFSSISPALRPTFNLASYVNDSPTLQELVKLGVELYKFDGKSDVMETILKLNFERDIKPYIQFLYNYGVPIEELGKFFTKNPMIFTQHMDDLVTRINYLEYRKFSKEMITEIIRKHPMWLSYSTVDIDASLGFFQKKFYLSGDNVRSVTIKLPRLITWPKPAVNLIMFSLNEEMGFNRSERKKLLLVYPKIYVMSKYHLLQRFNYVHNNMGICHDSIVVEPKILSSRLYRTKQRHEYLKYLNRAQYDCTKPNFVPLIKIVEGNDSEFCVNVAKTSVEMFNTYLKTVK